MANQIQMRTREATTKAYSPAATSSKTMPQAPHRERLGDVEQTEERERDQAMSPAGGTQEERDPLADHFVDDHEAGIGTARFSLHDGGRGNAECDGGGDADCEGECECEGGGMEGEGECAP